MLGGFAEPGVPAGHRARALGADHGGRPGGRCQGRPQHGQPGRAREAAGRRPDHRETDHRPPAVLVRGGPVEIRACRPSRSRGSPRSSRLVPSGRPPRRPRRAPTRRRQAWRRRADATATGVEKGVDAAAKGVQKGAEATASAANTVDHKLTGAARVPPKPGMVWVDTEYEGLPQGGRPVVRRDEEGQVVHREGSDQARLPPGEAGIG